MECSHKLLQPEQEIIDGNYAEFTEMEMQSFLLRLQEVGFVSGQAWIFYLIFVIRLESVFGRYTGVKGGLHEIGKCQIRFGTLNLKSNSYGLMVLVTCQYLRQCLFVNSHTRTHRVAELENISLDGVTAIG